MSAEKNSNYISQGRLDPSEAKVILPRLKAARIRFEISPNVSGRRNFRAPLGDARIEIFVHPDDLDAWQAIRGEYYI